RQIAQAIDFAHARGIVHGDIKPENVLFRDEARSAAVLSDFGMSTHFALEEPISVLTRDAGGTTIYLSPEQISNNKQTARSDIYSFGMVAYELLTGAWAVPNDISAFQQMQAKVQGNLTPPRTHNPDLPSVVCDVLMRSLDLDPQQRPSSAALFCDTLEGRSILPEAPPARRETTNPPAVDR